LPWIWTPTNAAELTTGACYRCEGKGLVCENPVVLCACVYRGVFRACWRKFRRLAHPEVETSRVTYGRIQHGVDRSLCWYRRNEDYCADFHSAGRRALPKHLYRVFSFIHLQGADAELVTRRLGVSGRQLRDWIAEVELAVGREIAHQQPYSLYPPSLYFGDSLRVA
jgi:hypothetical protein